MRTLRPYQEQGIDFAYERDSAMLLCPMGAGKTVIAFTALAELLSDGVIHRALVVAPKAVVETVWEQERDAWPHLARVTTAKCLGTIKQRQQALAEQAQVTLVNYENLEWLLLEYGKGKLPFDALVLDETSKMKSTKSYRFHELRRHVDHFSYRLGLSATPASEGLMDFFGQARMVDGGQALGRSVTPFRNKYFLPLDPNGWAWELRPGAEEEILNKLKSFCYLVDPADYAAQLPPLVEDIIQVPMHGRKARRAYADMKETWVYEGIEAANAGARVNKLRQITSGFLYETEHADELEAASVVPPYLNLHTERVDVLADIVEQQQKNPIIVAYNYQAELDMIQKKVDGKMWRPELLKPWNAGKIPVMFLHPKSGGHGINLQKGGNRIIWYSLPWSRDEYEQTIGRLRRQGQEADQVWNYILQTPGTVDAKVYRALNEKGDVQARVMEELGRE